MTTYEVVRKLIGPIDPVGQTDRDTPRFENLKEMCSLVDKLLHDISAVSNVEHSHEHSVKKAGKYAADFIKGQKEFL